MFRAQQTGSGLLATLSSALLLLQEDSGTSRRATTHRERRIVIRHPHGRILKRRLFKRRPILLLKREERLSLTRPGANRRLTILHSLLDSTPTPPAVVRCPSVSAPCGVLSYKIFSNRRKKSRPRRNAPFGKPPYNSATGLANRRIALGITSSGSGNNVRSNSGPRL